MKTKITFLLLVISLSTQAGSFDLKRCYMKDGNFDMVFVDDSEAYGPESKIGVSIKWHHFGTFLVRCTQWVPASTSGDSMAYCDGASTGAIFGIQIDVKKPAAGQKVTEGTFTEYMSSSPQDPEVNYKILCDLN